ncbi:hypothetical protein FSB84_14345 [Pseudobacter ginsenosidimutans]|uniref:hypothetical protein n=1 Tax=Pseudobacter ginsenosidimutans TaxID=661488 RepID=UPI0011BBAF46|nr:hypothetical protein [Pseudobacter ginsenosidimutans]QEC42812.1 hypothetical protein FSB84_14345 [Pseudobacter ginsenosidimutans]
MQPVQNQSNRNDGTVKGKKKRGKNLEKDLEKRDWPHTFATHSETASSFKYCLGENEMRIEKKPKEIFGKYTMVTYLCTPLERVAV